MAGLRLSMRRLRTIESRGREGLFGVRPEHFDVVPAEALGLPSKLSWWNRLAPDTLIHFDVAGTPAIARVDPR